MKSRVLLASAALLLPSASFAGGVAIRAPHAARPIVGASALPAMKLNMPAMQMAALPGLGKAQPNCGGATCGVPPLPGLPPLPPSVQHDLQFYPRQVNSYAQAVVGDELVYTAATYQQLAADAALTALDVECTASGSTACGGGTGRITDDGVNLLVHLLGNILGGIKPPPPPPTPIVPSPDELVGWAESLVP